MPAAAGRDVMADPAPSKPTEEPKKADDPPPQLEEDDEFEEFDREGACPARRPLFTCLPRAQSLLHTAVMVLHCRALFMRHGGSSPDPSAAELMCFRSMGLVLQSTFIPRGLFCNHLHSYLPRSGSHACTWAAALSAARQRAACERCTRRKLPGCWKQQYSACDCVL